MLHYTWGALWFDNERRQETAKYEGSKDVLEQIKFKYGPEVRGAGGVRVKRRGFGGLGAGDVKRSLATTTGCPFV